MAAGCRREYCALKRMEQELLKKPMPEDELAKVGVDIDFQTNMQYKQGLYLLPWLGELRFEPEVPRKDLRFILISKRIFFG
jgi:hypothetical protein